MTERLPESSSLRKVHLLDGGGVFNVAILIGLGYLLALTFFNPVPLMDADSMSYISFHPSRSMGYPLFLKAIKILFSSYKAVFPLQFFFYWLATLRLAQSMKLFYRSNIAGYLILLLLWSNPACIKLLGKILTEGLAPSILCLMLAYLLDYGRTKDLSLLRKLSFAMGISILLRPVNYALVPSLVLLIFWAWPYTSSKIKLSRVLFLPLGLVLGFGACSFWLQHGHFKTQSFLGHNLIGKAALFVTAKTPSEYPSFMKALSQKITPVRSILEKAPSSQIRYILSAPYYDQIRYNGPIEEGLRQTKLRLPPVQKDRFWLWRSWEIIKAHPEDFLKDTLSNWTALWLLWDFQTPQTTLRLKKFIQDMGLEKKMELPSYLFKNRSISEGGMLSFRMVMGLLSLVTVGLIGWLKLGWLFERPMRDSFWPLAIASLWIYKSYFVIAVLQAGLPRYACALWPCLFVVAVGVLVETVRGIRPRFQP